MQIINHKPGRILNSLIIWGTSDSVKFSTDFVNKLDGNKD